MNDAEPNAGTIERDTLHAVYSDLQAALTLSDEHRAALHKRGLTDEEIDRRGYRTLGRDRRKVVSELHKRYGSALLRIPGFEERDGKPRLAGAPGLLIPVYVDEWSFIRAFKVRKDEGEPRYVWLKGSGSHPHRPLGLDGTHDAVRLTEGELKADIATALSGLPTIGAPGVGSWRQCLPVLREMKAKTVRLAFDQDEAGAKALKECADELAKEFTVELETWTGHKGIDDLLAARGTPVVLIGDAAIKAIQDIATAAGLKDHETILARFPEVIGKGAKTFFADSELLQSLAHVAVNDPARLAGYRAELKTAKISLRDFDRAIAPRKQKVHNAQPMPVAAGESYRVVDGKICQIVLTQNGPAEIPLGNFNASITQEITRDDGAERWTVFGIEGDGLPLIHVRASKYDKMEWVKEEWGGKAIIYAGAGRRDNLRAAIEILSRNRERKVEYTHTGWRVFNDGRWYFLHGDGAIGESFQDNGINVSLPDGLSGFKLPGHGGVDAVRASLRLLELGPEQITFPILSAVYRAVLGESNFSLFLCGTTGIFKTELAALAQQHFGAGLNAGNLPGNWSSTANALEMVGFTLKDVLYVVDDFAPTSGHLDRMHRDADRVFRGQGNKAARQRLNRDCTVRPPKGNRALPLATGEDLPSGHSLRARMLIIEMKAGDIDSGRLTACQQDAAAGLYAQAMSGFVRWLAPNMSGVSQRLHSQACELRAKASEDGQHARTPDIAGNVALGLRYFLEFAEGIKAISAAESAALWDRGWQAILTTARRQQESHEAAEPTSMFLRLLGSAISSYRCHIDGLPGLSSGRCVGWLDDGIIFLDPDASYAEVQRLAGEQGSAFPVSVATLGRRLKEKGLLVLSEDERATVRKSDRSGTRRRVWAVDRFWTGSEPVENESGPRFTLQNKGVGPVGPVGPVPALESAA